MAARKSKVVKLVPPDLKQCQAEITKYRPFVMGGNPRTRERCSAKPVTIATEKKPGADGQRGSMSLCAECRLVCEKQVPGLTFEAIP